MCHAVVDAAWSRVALPACQTVSERGRQPRSLTDYAIGLGAPRSLWYNTKPMKQVKPIKYPKSNQIRKGDGSVPFAANREVD